MKTISQMLFEIMLIKDCTQEELAKQLKVNCSCLNGWINRRKSPNEENAKKIKELHNILTR